MSVNVELAGHGAYVRVDVVGYENSSTDDLSDANWLTCRVEVCVGGFEGRVAAAFTTHDFDMFRRSLDAAVADVKGDASFETYEDALRLHVAFDKTGAVSVTGTLNDPDGPTSLAFSFESDQTFMRSTVDALSELGHQFPVRT